jgi:hypothetical protein
VAPIDNVWLPAGNDPAVIVKWIAQNVDDDAYNRRALLIPNKNHFTAQPAAVQHYAANGNVGTNKSHAAQHGGAVLAYAADIDLLGYGMQVADGQLLAVTAWGRDEEISGWVAATKALNVVTGERHPGVLDEIHDALVDLEKAGYNGYHQRGAYFKALREEPIAQLIAAGYSCEFAAGYLLALGSPAGRLGRDLKNIYC